MKFVELSANFAFLFFFNEFHRWRRNKYRDIPRDTYDKELHGVYVEDLGIGCCDVQGSNDAFTFRWIALYTFDRGSSCPRHSRIDQRTRTHESFVMSDVCVLIVAQLGVKYRMTQMYPRFMNRVSCQSLSGGVLLLRPVYLWDNDNVDTYTTRTFLLHIPMKVSHDYRRDSIVISCTKLYTYVHTLRDNTQFKGETLAFVQIQRKVFYNSYVMPIARTRI